MGKETHLPNCLWMGFVSSQEGMLIHLYTFIYNSMLIYIYQLLVPPRSENAKNAGFVTVYYSHLKISIYVSKQVQLYIYISSIVNGCLKIPNPQY